MPKTRRLTTETVTHRDIARRCGLARSTVSRALQNDPAIKEETRAIIQQTARDMGYNAEAQESARRLVFRQYGKVPTHSTIAVLMEPSGQLSTYDARVFAGIWQEAYAHGYALVTTYLDVAPENKIAVRFPPVLARNEVDGIILAVFPPHLVYPTLTTFLSDRTIGDFPLACLFSNEVPGVISVTPDYFQVGYQAGQYLLALGHRHLLHYHYPTLYGSSTDERLAGVVAAYQDAGLDAQSYLHRFPLTDLMTDPHSMANYLATHAATSEQARSHPLITYLQAHPDITAVIGINDVNAILAWRLLEIAGYHIPDEMSVIGCDDTEAFPDDLLVNRLTTIHLPLEEIGRQAARRVIAQAEHGDIVAERVVLPITLRPGQSSGPVTRASR